MGILVYRIPISICEKGHVGSLPLLEDGQLAEMVIHKCGKWTWVDGKFCIHCGGKVVGDGPDGRFEEKNCT